MVGGRNWDKHNRKTRAAAARQRPLGRSGPRGTFEALAFLLTSRTYECGNFVIVPGNWESLSDADLDARRIAHRRKACAENKAWFDRSAGDRWVRIGDEAVEGFEIRNCDICASFVRRN